MKNHNTKIKGEAIYLVTMLLLVIGYSIFSACNTGGTISPEPQDTVKVSEAVIDSIVKVEVDSIAKDTTKAK